MNRQQRAMMKLLRERRACQFNPLIKVSPPTQGKGWLGEVDRAWTNGWYAVLGRPVATAHGEAMHLACRDLEGSPLLWAELQWIKDQVAGEQATAIEIYPPADQLVDAANMYHLWVLPAGYPLPFTIHTGRLEYQGEERG